MGNCWLSFRKGRLSVDDKPQYQRTYLEHPRDGKGHGAISNEQAENRLKIKGATNGMFLVYDEPPDEKLKGNRRHRAMNQGQYLLAVYYNGEVHRIRILRCSDGKYVLGQDVPGVRAHDSVHKLIKHHRRPFGKAINLEGGGRVTLEGYVYVKASVV